MEYSEDFICRSYRTAKNQRYQITVLKELNACKTQDILDILVKNNEIKCEKSKNNDRTLFVDSVTNEILGSSFKKRIYNREGLEDEDKRKTLRNRNIYKKYCLGYSAENLSKESGLTVTRVYQILRAEAKADNKDFKLLKAMHTVKERVS